MTASSPSHLHPFDALVGGVAFLTSSQIVGMSRHASGDEEGLERRMISWLDGEQTRADQNRLFVAVRPFRIRRKEP